jgi:branched-chain amino acid transport system permease protein
MIKSISHDKKTPVLLILLSLLVLFPLFASNAYWVQLVALCMLYAYWSSGWNIIGGFAGQLSNGHAVYVGIGAYVTIILYKFENVSPWIGMLVAGLVAMLISVVIGVICFQLKGSYYTLSTVALLYVARIYFMSSRTVLGYETNAALGLKLDWVGENFLGLQFRSKTPYYYIILVMMVLCIALCAYIKRSKIGYYLSAINTNQNAAASLGASVMGYKLIALLISAFLTAVGGGVYAFFLSVVDPATVFSYELALKIMLLAVVGGRGTLWGPVLGAFILIPINEIMRSQLGSRLAGISFVFYGILMMIIVFFLPKGLVGIKEVINNIRNKGNVKKSTSERMPKYE